MITNLLQIQDSVYHFNICYSWLCFHSEVTHLTHLEIIPISKWSKRQWWCCIFIFIFWQCETFPPEFISINSRTKVIAITANEYCVSNPQAPLWQFTWHPLLVQFTKCILGHKGRKAWPWPQRSYLLFDRQQQLKKKKIGSLTHIC